MADRRQPATASRDERNLEITIAVLLAGLTYGTALLLAHALGHHVYGAVALLAMAAAAAVALAYLASRHRVRRRR